MPPGIELWFEFFFWCVGITIGGASPKMPPAIDDWFERFDFPLLAGTSGGPEANDSGRALLRKSVKEWEMLGFGADGDTAVPPSPIRPLPVRGHPCIRMVTLPGTVLVDPEGDGADLRSQ